MKYIICFVSWAALLCSTSVADRPNIILILADDLGYSDLGCYGGEIETPSIDALAAGGARLTQFYNSARCCPTRASLTTGLYPSQAGIGDFTTRNPNPNRGPGYLGRLNNQCVTLAEVLKPAGYGCYYVGKWHMHPDTGPIKRGFDEFYGYTRGHSHDQYDADYYIRLPQGRDKEIDPPGDQYYATDVFNDYAVEFIRQGQASGQPWFIFLGHSSPHFPVQAPADRADKYDEVYRRGWDVLREERYERMKGLGLIDGDHWQLTPRSIVPVDKEDIANGFPGQPNPAWDSLDEDRQRDLARRMAVYAAMVESVDEGVGQIVEHLKQTGELDNTLVLFLSDNGACYEWGPFGFDGPSRRGTTILHEGDDLRKIGGPGTHQSYGSAWSNLGNTPFRLYKHFTHEGGICSPLIAHWPKGIGTPDRWIRDPAHVMDIMPTLLEATGAAYPEKQDGNVVTPMEGTSLLPAMRGQRLPKRTMGFDHQGARALREGDWKLVWSKRMPHEIEWELYNLAEDRCETNDLAAEHPDRVETMAAEWDRWARRVQVIHEPPAGSEAPQAAKETRTPETPETPEIANRPLTITGRVRTSSATGVIVAQGGREQGYAVHLLDGRLVFDVRVNGDVTRIASTRAAPSEFDFEARLTADRLLLRINGRQVAATASPGLIPVQPKDGLNIGRDELSAAGDYQSPNPLDGTITEVGVTTGPARKNTKPFQSELITTWGAEVTAQNAWTEYPRPQLRRDQWQNLNGYWQYAITSDSRTEPPADWVGQILVPFCLESRLSGVQRLLDPSEALWYRRAFTASTSPTDRTLLHFEAVDYRCEAFVNGQSVGTHQGGNTPFSFDVTEAIRDGQNELIVRVEDETVGWQLRGKQVLNPRGIWYTQVSGIWQTVWLETVGRNYIRDLKISTDATEGTISIRPIVQGTGTVKAVITDDDTPVAAGEGVDSVTLRVQNAKLWSPESPHLYDLEISLVDDSGRALDRVESYAGIRSVGKVQDADGHWHFTLNGQPILHWGPLDQGWWPDGLLTPPSDDAMRFDIEWLKRAGFNMIRKHIKVEPRRYYYHCDRLGMMVWQDHVSGGTRDSGWPEWTRLKPDPVDADWPDPEHRQFMLELERMIDTLENHPSIACWVPFNERWGQHRTMQVGKWTVQRDPSRMVNIASGGNFWPVGDIVDAHKYPHPEFPFEDGQDGRFDAYIKGMGEFGGHGYPVEGHLWDPDRRNWGYGNLPQNQAEYKERYVTSLNMLNELRAEGIAAGVYTQTTDVEGEINGLMSYDRKVIKIPAEELAELHTILFEPVAREREGTRFPPSAFIQQKTDRKPGPVMDAETIRAGLESHDRALYIKAGWIRDPYITLGPDDVYYLAGTQPREGDPREAADPYNIGLGDKGIVGDQVRLWHSRDLIEWESLGPIFTVDDTVKARNGANIPRRLIWAPEVHWLPEFGDNGRWALLHCPASHSSLALSAGGELKGPWTHPMEDRLGRRHDPSLFQDDDGTWYLLWGNTLIAPLSSDFSRYIAEPVRIDPAGSRTNALGETKSVIGHEGATMIEVGGKYVHLGTAWSTDQGRKGSYNLYYCVADKITGPYGPRKFAGRFLGHGTLFQTRDGKWWCTAFFNANVPPLPREGIETRDLSENAQTINEQGVTIVPLDVRVLDNGSIFLRAKDPAYASPGPDEVQKFELED